MRSAVSAECSADIRTTRRPGNRNNAIVTDRHPGTSLIEAATTNGARKVVDLHLGLENS